MSSQTAIMTTKAPVPLAGIFSQAIVARGVVYRSGIIALNPQSDELVGGNIEDRTRQCLENLRATLAAAGSSMDDAVKVNCYLANMADFAAMNTVYTQYFGEVKPSRTCVAVKTLPLGTDIEIECIALVTEN